MHYIFLVLLLTACNLEERPLPPSQKEEPLSHVLFYDNQLDLDSVLKKDKKSSEQKNKQKPVSDLSKEKFPKNPKNLVIIH